MYCWLIDISLGLKAFLRDSFIHILEGIKVPNKVMSGYVDDCISTMIKNCCFKSCIIYLVNEMRENKAKVVRERCMVRLRIHRLHYEIVPCFI
jgi:hypothetical protein